MSSLAYVVNPVNFTWFWPGWLSSFQPNLLGPIETNEFLLFTTEERGLMCIIVDVTWVCLSAKLVSKGVWTMKEFSNSPAATLWTKTVQVKHMAQNILKWVWIFLYRFCTLLVMVSWIFSKSFGDVDSGSLCVVISALSAFDGNYQAYRELI